MAFHTGVKPAVVVGESLLSGIDFAVILVSAVDFRAEKNSASRVVVDVDETVRSFRGSNGAVYGGF